MSHCYGKNAPASAAAAIILAIAFTACSNGGNSSVVPLSAYASRQTPASIGGASGTFSYALLADTLGNAVDFFKPNGMLAKQLTNGLTTPTGLFVDAQSNLWVADASGAALFPPGADSPTRTLSDPNQFPADVASAADGTVYVANFESTGTYGPGSVSVYPPGHNRPTRFLRDPNAQYVTSVTCDVAGNVFATINDYTEVGYVDEFVSGKQSGFQRLAPSFSYALQIRIDNVGNLVVLDEQQHLISEFTEAGIPTGVNFHTKANWTAFALDSSGAQVLGGVDVPDSFKGTLSAYPHYDRIRNFHIVGMGLIGGAAFMP